MIPRENRQLIQPSNKIPPRGDVARYEDTEGENRKGVHEFSRSRCSVSAFFFFFSLRLRASPSGEDGGKAVFRSREDVGKKEMVIGWLK